jgi:ring-1,2-phenylacetyl-CoA epoxidase subunit PaaC
MPALDEPTRAALFAYLLRLGDDRLVLGHRISEWCGHAPILEEDIALTNIALDLIGQAAVILGLAGETEAKGRDADALAYLREAIDYRNVLLVELPRGDFAFTTIRQFLFSVAAHYQLDALTKSAHPIVAGFAAKAVKETRYHVRHAADWVLKLGDGTVDSHRRAQDAVDALWRFTGEMFLMDDVDRILMKDGFAPDLTSLEPEWHRQVSDVLARATLVVPSTPYMQRGGRTGRHTEDLGHLLSEMQILQRSYPGAKW